MTATAETRPLLTTDDARLDRLADQRENLRLRHSQRLAELLEQREDLRGVNALADFVSASVRWSA
ncbi:hypothetical protein [Nocardioides bruguierae]|uniref:Uncharacterized protein n=1 Tax=Nocardioides bruguierae TaxID=2945102 RepID=A0A9X2IEC0_9ACTN|nr:hypothetical protein [Nocardioides bruguierae]MCL8025519.1 hypothetical protein [Nocardioides bruguierae]MCL8027406.1 hypothetical protein [Nocardioides bruguierae]MCM0620676.1 hypothetical protein [Nocardioides bruguierae]